MISIKKALKVRTCLKGFFFGGTPRAVSQLLQRADVRLAQNDVIFSRGTVAQTCHLAAILKVCLKGGGWNVTVQGLKIMTFSTFCGEIFKSDIWRCMVFFPCQIWVIIIQISLNRGWAHTRKPDCWGAHLSNSDGADILEFGGMKSDFLKKIGNDHQGNSLLKVGWVHPQYKEFRLRPLHICRSNPPQTKKTSSS